MNSIYLANHQEKKREGVQQSMDTIRQERQACEEARLASKTKVLVVGTVILWSIG